MSSVTLLLILLLVTVGLLLATGLFYVVNQNPALATPLMVATSGLALFVASASAILIQ